MLTLTTCGYAIALATALYVRRRLHRLDCDRVQNADHIVHNDRIALARHVELTLRAARQKRGQS